MIASKAVSEAFRLRAASATCRDSARMRHFNSGIDDLQLYSHARIALQVSGGVENCGVGRRVLAAEPRTCRQSAVDEPAHCWI